VRRLTTPPLPCTGQRAVRQFAGWLRLTDVRLRPAAFEDSKGAEPVVCATMKESVRDTRLLPRAAKSI
jgi:hypothetical protein